MNVKVEEKSLRTIAEETFYVKLGPTPAFVRPPARASLLAGPVKSLASFVRVMHQAPTVSVEQFVTADPMDSPATRWLAGDLSRSRWSLPAHGPASKYEALGEGR
jgi:hypothetical protein